MRRPTLILIIVLAVILIGGGLYLWLSKTTITLPWVKTTNTTNTNSGVPTTITNTTNRSTTTVTLPSEVKGDTAVSGKLTIGTITLNVSSLQKQTTMGAETAEKGKTFLLVYFDPVAPTEVLAVDDGLRTVKVTDGTTNYSVINVSVISTTVQGGRGYMKFLIPEDAKNLKLQLGAGATLQSVTLP